MARASDPRRLSPGVYSGIVRPRWSDTSRCLPDPRAGGSAHGQGHAADPIGSHPGSAGWPSRREPDDYRISDGGLLRETAKPGAGADLAITLVGVGSPGVHAGLGSLKRQKGGIVPERSPEIEQAVRDILDAMVRSDVDEIGRRTARDPMRCLDRLRRR